MKTTTLALALCASAPFAFGLGDTTRSLFFSPKDPEPFIWGLGPHRSRPAESSINPFIEP